MATSTKIQLVYLPKQYGSRNYANTFMALCSNSTESNTSALLHMPTNEFNYDMPIIVKIQDCERLYNRELCVMQLLREHNIPNTIHHISHFSCKDDIVQWKEPTIIPEPVCNGSGQNDIHIIVMKYIEHNFRKELRKCILPEKIIKNTIKQLMYLVLQLWYTCKIIHGDLNGGNVLLDIGTPKTNTYTIGKYIRRVDTLGYEPILIDFQKANILTFRNTAHTFNEFILIQPARIFYLFGYYVSNRHEIREKLESAKTLKELLTVIDSSF
jgi:serine/threonine protein kinase